VAVTVAAQGALSGLVCVRSGLMASGRLEAIPMWGYGIG